MPERMQFFGRFGSPVEFKPGVIPDKRTMFAMLKAGEFGNTMPLWYVDEFLAYLEYQPFPKMVAIRALPSNEIGSPPLEDSLSTALHLAQILIKQ